MTKKIIAGVVALALVMGSAVLPSGMFENVSEKPMITASAYSDDDIITSGDYKYGILNDGTAVITAYTGSASTLIVPSTIDGKTVSGINKQAFGSCDSLTDVTISEGITKIGFGIFWKCSNLKNVTFPKSVTELGDFTFYACKSLTEIVLPDTIVKIGGGAFTDCIALKSVVLPKDLTDIASCLFRNCTSLTDVAIPIKVTKIDYGAFSECSSLADITIPNSVTEIAYIAFSECDSLKSITIPSTVTKIGSEVFGYSNSIKLSDFKIYCYANTAGEKYAKDNEFGYELLDVPVVTTTTTTVTTAKPATTTKNTTTTKKVTTTKKATTTTKKVTSVAKKNVKNASVPKIPDKAYTGKAICPAVKVKYGKTVLKKNTDYTVSYKYNKAIGKASVIIKGKGKYNGTKTVSFKINPKKQTVKLASYDNAFKASWSKNTQATGYQVKYARAKSFKGSTTVTAGKTTTSKKIKGKNKTIYYVKVRTYKTVNGTRYYGAWSTAKAVKTK